MKFSILSIIFTLLIFINENSVQCSPINDGNSEKNQHCRCVLNENCYNGYLNTEGVGIIALRNDVEIQQTSNKCSNSSYVCCLEENQKEKTTFSPEKPTAFPDKISKNEKLTSNNNAEECGKQKPSINVRVNHKLNDSSSTVDGEFPWIISIHMKEIDGVDDKFKFKCAGTLLNENIILTAAHCVKNFKKKTSYLKILANALSNLKEIGDDPDHERSVRKIVIHPEYYAGGPHNDVALIFLESSYNETSELNPICTPSLDVTKDSFDTTRCLAIGWGNDPKNRILKKVELPLIPHEKCEEMLRKTKLGKDFKLHDSFLCAGGTRGRDTCKGDGGGPLMCPDKYGFLYQFGIVSWGVGCAEENHPGVYTDVAKFQEWILENFE